jgi:hypothetical protein
LLTVLHPVEQALRASVTLLVSSTGLDPRADLNNDGIPDWVQSTAANPTTIPALLTPILQTPAWLNLGLLLALAGAPLAWLAWKRPDWLTGYLDRRAARHERDRRDARRLGLKARKLDADQDLQRDALRAGATERRHLLGAKERIKRSAQQNRLQALRLEADARARIEASRASLAQQTHAATVAALARERDAAARARSQDLALERTRLQEEVQKARRPAPTIINVGKAGRFRRRRR